MLSRLLHSDGTASAELVAHAQGIAAVLGRSNSPRVVVLSCRHACSFVPGMLGAWMAGATVDLLPNVQAGTLDRVDADAGVEHVLHDDPARQQRSPKAIYIPGVAPARTPIADARWPDVAVRMTTSGTTERPKYVTKSMAQLLSELEVLASVVPRARCVMSTVPLSHLYGLLFGALLPLRFGARIVSHTALLPADVAAVIEREAVDLLISTPAHLRAMAAIAMPRGLRVLTSGARMPAELHTSLAAEHDWQITDVLGSTETGGIATREQPMEPWTPLPEVTVSASAGRLVVESPWTGGSRVELDDRIELRPEGGFQYLGRNQELIKIAGKRAHAQAIEATVLALPGVRDVASIVHAANGREPRVAIAVSVDPGAKVTRQDITDAIRHQFDAVFVPKILKLVAAIPRTERGKIDAPALRDLLALAPVSTTNQVAMRRIAAGHYEVHIPRDLVFFQGHFDALTILPGAVLVERVVWPIVKAELPQVGELRGIRRLRFRRPVLPDQQLQITVKHGVGRVTFDVAAATTAVASGQLVVDQQPVKSP